MTSDLQPKPESQPTTLPPNLTDTPVCATGDTECMKRWLESANDCI